MADGSDDRYHSAVVVFRPDNFFTIGLMFVIVYLAGAFAAQLLMRAGILPDQSGHATAPQPAPGTVMQ